MLEMKAKKTPLSNIYPMLVCFLLYFYHNIWGKQRPFLSEFKTFEAFQIMNFLGMMSNILNKNNRIIHGLQCRTKPGQLQTRKSCTTRRPGKSKGHVSTSRSCEKTPDDLLLVKGNMMCPLNNVKSMTYLFLCCFTVM